MIPAPGKVTVRLLAALVIVLTTASAAAAAEFVVKPGAPNRVVFTSKAATETFTGTTDRMEGRIVFDPAAPGDSIEVRITVDVASLDTGIGKRNQHMRENHLETKAYPTAMFEGAALRAPVDAVFAPGATVPVEVEGTFTLHGVSRPLHVTVKVTLRDDATLAFETEFSVVLADYNISRPKFLFLKLSETQVVSVSGLAAVRR